MVGLAGPLSNFVLAALSSAIFHFTFSHSSGSSGGMNPYLWISEPVHQMALISVRFNLVLMVINLLPILPLDGGRIVAGLVPLQFAITMERFERFGMLIVLLLIASGAWSYIVGPVIGFFWHFLM